MKLFKLIVVSIAIVISNYSYSNLFAADNLSQFKISDKNIDDKIDSLLKDSDSQQADINQQKRNAVGFIDRLSIPNVFIATDMLFERDINNGRNNAITNNGFFVREVEFGFNTAIDHLALGTITFAVHNEAGEYFVELHEAYFEFNKLPLNLFFKLGRFFLDVGRLNSIHRHDWDFSNAPLVHEKFFDHEGVYDQGGELSLLMPFPFYQELKVGEFNGRTWGHTHGDGPVKPLPLLTARLKNFLSIYGNLGTQFGFSYIRYSPDDLEEDNVDNLFGVDLTFKWQHGKLRSFILSGEYWYKTEIRKNSAMQKKFGWYGYLQYKFHQNWSIGLRLDYYAELDEYVAFLDKNINKISYQYSAWVTFKPSEFSYFRLSIEQHDLYEADKKNYAVYVQTDFVLGAHAPHKY